MIRRPPRSTLSSSSAASDVYKRQGLELVHDPARRRREDMSVTPLRDRPVHAHVGADHPHIAHELNGRKHPMPAGSRREREGCSFASQQRRHAATRSDTVLPTPHCEGRASGPGPPAEQTAVSTSCPARLTARASREAVTGTWSAGGVLPSVGTDG